MAAIVREITSKTWFQNDLVSREYPWLGPQDLQSDAFKGVRTSKNELSIYLIEGEGHKAAEAVDRVLAALAATRDHVPQLDYVVISRDAVQALALELTKTLGNTPDPEVNSWHLDLVKLNSTRLVAFCQALQKSGTFSRKSIKQVAKLLDTGLATGHLDASLVNPKLKESIARYL